MSVYYLVLGPERLKERRKEAVRRRSMKEAFDQAQAEKRKLLKGRKEEEFIKIPDESLNISSTLDSTLVGPSDLLDKQS